MATVAATLALVEQSWAGNMPAMVLVICDGGSAGGQVQVQPGEHEFHDLATEIIFQLKQGTGQP